MYQTNTQWTLLLLSTDFLITLHIVRTVWRRQTCCLFMYCLCCSRFVLFYDAPLNFIVQFDDNYNATLSWRVSKEGVDGYVYTTIITGTWHVTRFLKKRGKGWGSQVGKNKLVSWCWWWISSSNFQRHLIFFPSTISKWVNLRYLHLPKYIKSNSSKCIGSFLNYRSLKNVGYVITTDKWSPDKLIWTFSTIS